MLKQLGQALLCYGSWRQMAGLMYFSVISVKASSSFCVQDRNMADAVHGEYRDCFAHMHIFRQGDNRRNHQLADHFDFARVYLFAADHGDQCGRATGWVQAV